MPAPKKFASSPDYLLARSEAHLLDEARDCGVKAVSIATGKSYAEVHAFMAANGRRAKRGSKTQILDAAIAHFGFKQIWLSPKMFLDRLPKPHCDVLKNVTTHHPDRFPGLFPVGRAFLLFTAGHVLCVKDGVNHDWTRGKVRRVNQIYEIVSVS